MDYKDNITCYSLIAGWQVGVIINLNGRWNVVKNKKQKKLMVERLPRFLFLKLQEHELLGGEP